MDFIKQFFKQLQNVFKKLNPTQRFIVLVVSVASIAVILLMMLWASQKEYVVLFSNLDPKDAQAIREKLDEKGIKYRLETDGTAILVPEGQETGLRLEVISQGMISQAGIG